MTSPADDPKQRALKREWVAARFVVLGGLLIAAGAVGYFAYRQGQSMRAENQAATQVQPAPKIDSKLLARVELAVCSAELARAKDIGIVPAYGELASPRLLRAGAPKRFVCEAMTRVTHYFIAADLRCNNLADARCVSIYRIAVKDGELVYERRE
ncbi:MAG TPA: hypothetical protein VN154_12890 [Rhizomicrobium sp.]|nr:hypothetical protein [Rhizomicrobium sp.]